MYTNPSYIIDTIIHILNAEQDLFRDFVRVYESEKADRQFPLTIAKGIFNTRPREVMPLLEIEPENESVEWFSTRTQMPTFNVKLLLSVINSNQELSVEYVTGWTQRIKLVLNNPKRLQSWVISDEGQKQYKWLHGEKIAPLSYVDSLITDISYNTSQSGTIRQAEFSWFCKILEPMREKDFIGNWPHHTSPFFGAPNTGPNV